MSIVNFAITQPLESRVNQIIKEQGFMSKAEFFRFITLNYINNIMPSDISQTEYEESVQGLKQSLRKKFDNKKLPSLKEQLADLQ